MIGSVPTVVARRPTVPETSPFSIEPSERLATMERVRMKREKYSQGPNLRASRPSQIVP
jgi:hypothetical protein